MENQTLPMQVYTKKAYNRLLSLYASGSPLRYVRKYLNYAVRFPTYLDRKNASRAVNPENDHHPILNALRIDGYADVTSQIDARLFQILDQEAQKKRSIKPSGESVNAREYFGELLSAQDYAVSNAFVKFALQEKFLKITAAYFGEAPKLSGVNLLLSRVSKSKKWEESQLWHRDYNDTRILKLFVYFNDVFDEGAGPFTFIPAPFSKNVKNDHLIPRRITDAQMEQKGGAAHSKSVFGKKGTAFLIDTYRCFHLGSRCSTQDRLAYIATYSTMAELYPYNPPFQFDESSFSKLGEMALKP